MKIFSKFTSPFKKQGRFQEQDDTSLVKNVNVDQEYVNALRTGSYLDLCREVQGHMEIKTSSSSFSLPQQVHLSDFVLKPRQESINKIFKKGDLNSLLVNYFENSFEACRICELLLRNIHETRTNYKTISKVMKLLRKVNNDEYHVVYKELGSFASLNNPLSTISMDQFQTIHDGHVQLLHKLTTKRKKIRRKRKIMRWFRKGTMALYTTLLIGLLVVAIHSIFGIVAIPCLITSSFILINKLKKKTLLKMRLEAQLDVAAKGVYILINDFDTISRLVRRLCDEMDHYKSIIDLCVALGKKEMLKEVMRDFEINKAMFFEILQELEESLYLCFLNINRSRRLVLEQVVTIPVKNSSRSWNILGKKFCCFG